MAALRVGMRCHKIRAISRQFIRQFHARAVYPRYVLLVVSRKLLWRETLRDKKRLIFSLSSGPVNPLQSLLAPGLRSARAIDRKSRTSASDRRTVTRLLITDLLSLLLRVRWLSQALPATAGACMRGRLAPTSVFAPGRKSSISLASFVGTFSPLHISGKQTPASDDSGAAALQPACQGGRYAPPRTPPGVNVTVLKTRYVHGYEH